MHGVIEFGFGIVRPHFTQSATGFNAHLDIRIMQATRNMNDGISSAISRKGIDRVFTQLRIAASKQLDDLQSVKTTQAFAQTSQGCGSGKSSSRSPRSATRILILYMPHNGFLLMAYLDVGVKSPFLSFKSPLTKRR